MKKLSFFFCLVASSFVPVSGNCASFPVNSVQALRNALTTAQNSSEDDTISMAPGHYLLASPLSYSDDGSAGALTLTASVPANRPVLDGQGATSILAVNTDRNGDYADAGCDIHIEGIVFQESNTDAPALSISSSQGSLLVRKCSFLNNQYGGLNLRTYSGAITVEQNSFRANQTPSGAGGGLNINTWSAAITVSGNIFTENTTTFAGGGASIVSEATSGVGAILIATNTFANNTAQTPTYGRDDMGGGLYCLSHGAVQIIGNTFSSNKALRYTGTSYGGGADISAEEIELTNNIFVNNNAMFGGAYALDDLYEKPCQFRGINNTVYNSTSGDMAVYIQFYAANSTAVLTNNVFWDESGDEELIYRNDAGSPLLLSYNILGRDADPATGQSQGLYIYNTTNYSHHDNRAGIDPLLLDDGHLRSASPAIDTGICGELNGIVYTRTAPYDDIDGDQRPGIGALFGCDVGADEYNGFPWTMFIPAIIRP